MNQNEKDLFVKIIRKRVEVFCKGLHIHRTCLFHAILAAQEFQKLGIKNKIQSGSMHYPIIDMALDDGKQPTHFSYQFESKMAYAMIAKNMFPELHIWNYLPDTQELVDLTTCYIPRQTKECTGLEFKGPISPDYIWSKDLPKNVIYEPNIEADAITIILIENLIKQQRYS